MSRRHLALLGLACWITAASLVIGGPASASDDTSTTTGPGATTSGAGQPKEFSELQGGIRVYRATSTCPGKPTATWDLVHAAAFFEVTAGAMTLGKLNTGSPPASAPVCQVEITYGLANSAQPSTFALSYAAVDSQVWVRSAPNDWAVGVPRMIEAFEGKVKPINGVDPSATTTTDASKSTPRSTSGDDDGAGAPVGLLVALGVVVVAVAVAVAIVVRRRGDTSRVGAGEASAAPPEVIEPPATDAEEGTAAEPDRSDQ